MAATQSGVDNRGYDYPLVRVKYGLLLALAPLGAAGRAVQTRFFLGLEPGDHLLLRFAIQRDGPGRGGGTGQFPSASRRWCCFMRWRGCCWSSGWRFDAGPGWNHVCRRQLADLHCRHCQYRRLPYRCTSTKAPTTTAHSVC